MPDNNLISSDLIQMIVASVTNQGHAQPIEVVAERLLNAIARAQLGVPTGVPSHDAPNRT